jgi:hypothetical protein
MPKKVTNPVVHEAADHAAWKDKWTNDRKPQAMAHGADKVDEVETLKVKHEVTDKNFADFKAHVESMKDKRKEMGAKNLPY